MTINLCRHLGCTEQAIECAYEPWHFGTIISDWYCPDHAFKHGFCCSCGQFWAGVESFDFGPGYCDNCASEFEEGDYDPDLDFGFEFDPYEDA